MLFSFTHQILIKFGPGADELDVKTSIAFNLIADSPNVKRLTLTSPKKKQNLSIQVFQTSHGARNWLI